MTLEQDLAERIAGCKAKAKGNYFAAYAFLSIAVLSSGATTISVAAGALTPAINATLAAIPGIVLLILNTFKFEERSDWWWKKHHRLQELYSTVLAAWIFVAFVFIDPETPSLILASIVAVPVLLIAFFVAPHLLHKNEPPIVSLWIGNLLKIILQGKKLDPAIKTDIANIEERMEKLAGNNRIPKQSDLTELHNITEKLL